MKLRWIDLGSVSPSTEWVVWEYPNISKFNISEPTVFTNTPNCNGIDFGSHEKMSDYLIKSEIPDDWKFIRGYTPLATEMNIGSPIFYSKDMVYFNFHLPDTYKPSKTKNNILMAYLKVLRGYGILGTKISTMSNDVMIYINGEPKKFGGILHQPWNNGWVSYNTYMTFNIDKEIIDKIIDFNSHNWKRKMSSISDYVGCIFDVDDTLSIPNITREVIDEVSRRLKLDVIPHTLSDEENVLLENYIKEIDKEDWLYNLKHPNWESI